MTIENEKEKISEKTVVSKLNINKKRIIIVFLILLIGSFALGLLSKDAIVSSMASHQGLRTEIREQFFIDINGDGLEDFVVYSEVVYNTGEANFLQGQQ